MLPRRWLSPTLRWLRLACAVGALVVIALPAALGAAMGPVLEQLGAAGEHACKCGMERGTCGCPACAMRDHQRLREQMPEQVPVAKRQCEKDAPGMTFAGLPMGVAAPVSAILRGPVGGHQGLPDLVSRPDQPDSTPPTPPPRIAAV